MTTRKSGLLGLMMLGMTVLAACEQKAPTVIVNPPPTDTTPNVTLSLVPSTATLTAVGQTVQLVAIVSGTTVQTATFTSSNTSVATVNATTGLVSAVANGVAVITAVSTFDTRARAGSTITVQIGAVTPPASPTISVQKITVAGNTNAPVNTSNTMGQIDVTLNMEVPVNSQPIARVEWVVDGTVVVCQQTFGQTGEIEVDASAVELVCSFDTAQLDATGAPRFPNGPHAISARVILGNGTVITATNSQTLVFNNQSFITARLDWLDPGTTTVKTTPCVISGSDIRSLGGPGTSWCGNADLRVTIGGVNFGNQTNDRLARATVTLSTSGIGVSGQAVCNDLSASAASGTVAPEDGGPVLLETGGARVSGGSPNPLTPGVTNTDADGDGLVDYPGCGVTTLSRTDTDAADGLSVTWLRSSTPTSGTPGIGGIEDVFAIQVNGITVGGQAGPTCVNPDPARNPLSAGGTTFICGTGSASPFGSAAGVAFFPQVNRLDNIAPRATLFDMTPGACALANCFVNGSFSFAPRTGFFVSVDYGSDSQNANTTFQSGASSTTLAPVVTGADLSETVTADALLVRATLRDGLGNEALIYPTTTSTTTTTSSTDAASQRFGVDRTAPEFDPALTTFPVNNGANDGLTYSFSFRDSGVGPSGFTATPVSVRVERITSAGTVCLNPESGATISCTTSSGFVSTDGTFDLVTDPGGPTTNATLDGYHRVTYSVSDQAGNATAQTTIITLIDNDAPGAGGIVAPSVITGNASASFSSATTDNVDLGDVLPAVLYGASGIVIEETRASVGTYGPPTETSTTATATISQFIRSIEMGFNGAIFRASDMAFLLRDIAGVVDNAGCPAVLANGAVQTADLTLATPLGTSTSPAAPGASNRGNCFVRLDPISNAVDAGIPAGARSTSNPNGEGFTSAGTGITGFSASSSAAVVCNSTGTGAGQPCPTNPSSTTLSAVATGPTGFANPFQRVNFYYRDLVTGRSIMIGSVNSPTVTDVGGVRSFTWQRVWSPVGLPGGPYTIDAIGIHSSGQGLRAGAVVTVDID